MRHATHRERGLTLLEILFALAIFTIIMAGVLQLFSAALLSDRVAEARTELSFRAQQAVETVRMADAIARSSTTVPQDLSAANTGITFPISGPTDPLTLPQGPSDPYWEFWGPSGVGVVEENPRYVVQVSIADGAAEGLGDVWVIRAVAAPRSAVTGQGGYVGFGRNRRAVRYVAYIRK